MRMLRLVALAALAGALLPACSLVFSGSRFTNGGSTDSGPQTDGGPPDSGPPPNCTTDEDCPDQSYCYDDMTGSPPYCAICDADGDGFAVMRGTRCAPMMRPFDCDDGDPARHPGALPICNDDIDQSCGTMLPGTLMPIDEVGFFGVQPVPVPSGYLPARVHVFSVSPDEARLFFQINDGPRTPLTAQVPLTADGMRSVSTQSVPDMTGMGFPAGTIHYDAHRDAVANIRVGMLVEGEEAEPIYHSIQTSFGRDGAVTILPGAEHRVASTAYPGLDITGQPSMIARSDQFYWGVPARATIAGSSSEVTMTMGADDTHIDVMHSAADPGVLWGSVSDGENAVFPGPFGTFHVWNGSLDSGNANEALQISPGITSVGRPGVASLRSTTPGNEVTAVVVPSGEGEAFLYLLDCASASAMSACPFAAGSPPQASYPLATMGGDPRLQVIPASATAIGVVFVQHPATDDSIGFAFVETAPLAGSISSFDVPAPGRGPILELDGDFLISPVAGAGPMAAQVTLSYAYLRHIDGQPPQLFVGGARVCAGIGHD